MLMLLSVISVLFVPPQGIFCWQIESQRKYHAEPETGDNTEGLCQAMSGQIIQCLREMQTA